MAGMETASEGLLAVGTPGKLAGTALLTGVSADMSPGATSPSMEWR